MKKYIYALLVMVLCGSLLGCSILSDDDDVEDKNEEIQVEEVMDLDITNEIETESIITTADIPVNYEEKNIEEKSEQVEVVNPNIIDYKDASSFENALNSGEKVLGKIVQFEVEEYHPTSALGINFWAGEHLNFISEKEFDVTKGDIVVGFITKQASKSMFTSWEIPFEVLEIKGKYIKEEINNVILEENQTMAPASSYMLNNDDVNDVVKLFDNAGFKNVQIQAIYDLDYNSIWSSASLDEVEMVTIDENEDFEEGDIFKKDSIVKILYHAFEKDNPCIEYTPYTVSKLFDDLESNPMRAEKEHLYEYVDITGEILEISSNGKHILICAPNDTFGLEFIYCGTDGFQDYIYNLSKGDMVTVRGKITVVNVIYDYAMDVYSFQ